MFVNLDFPFLLVRQFYNYYFTMMAMFLFLLISSGRCYPGLLENEGIAASHNGFVNFRMPTEYVRESVPMPRYIISSVESYVPSPQTLVDAPRQYYSPLELLNKHSNQGQEQDVPLNSRVSEDSFYSHNGSSSTHADLRDPKTAVKFQVPKSDTENSVSKREETTVPFSRSAEEENHNLSGNVFENKQNSTSDASSEGIIPVKQLLPEHQQESLQVEQQQSPKYDFPVSSSFHTNGTSTENMAMKDDQIVFLDDRGKGEHVNYTPKIGPTGPNCANGSTFCEEPDSYPKEYISGLVKKGAAMYKKLFENDASAERAIEVLNRLDRDEELCRYHERIVFPKMGKTVDDKWKFIANTDDIKQGVRVEVCDVPEGPCTLADSFPLGYTTQCRQKYVTRKMLSLTENGDAGPEDFFFPSCCACSISHVGDVDSRITKLSSRRGKS